MLPDHTTTRRRSAASPVTVGPAVQLRGVSAGYGGVTVLTELDLVVDRGELVGIVGPSGSGKTTLLRLLTGSAHHHRGEVSMLGRSLGRGGTPVRVGYVPQLEGIDWDFPVTVEQVVLLGDAASSSPLPWFSRAEKRAARELLDRLGLGGLHRRPIRDLSGGQQQRMFLARALLRRCELLLLDEPTSGVDLATRRDVLAALVDLNADGLTIVLTTHDLNFVASRLPRIVCLNGRIIADGHPLDVVTPASLERTYGAPMKVLHDGGRPVVVDVDDLHLSSNRSGELDQQPGSGRPSSPDHRLASTSSQDRDAELWP